MGWAAVQAQLVVRARAALVAAWVVVLGRLVVPCFVRLGGLVAAAA